MRLGLTIAFLLFCIYHTSCSPLVEYFKFDEGTSTTFVSSTTACHSTSPPLSGNCSGEWVTGKFGTGLDITSTSQIIELPKFNINPPNGQFSLSLWMYPHELTPGTTRYIIFKNQGWYLSLKKDRMDCGFRRSDNDISINYKGLAAETWQHIACTYNRSSLCIWINGEAKQCSSSSGSLTESDGPAYIGGYDSTPANAIIDEIMFWSSGLGITEIQTLYQRTDSFKKLNAKLSIQTPSLSPLDPIPEELNIPVLDPLSLTIESDETGNPPWSNSLQKTWFNNAPCDALETKSNDTYISFNFNTVESFIISCCVDDGIMSTELSLIVNVVESSPDIIQQPGPTIIVQTDQEKPLVIVVDPKTPSSFQWQRLTYVNATATENVTTNDEVKRFSENTFEFDDEYENIRLHQYLEDGSEIVYYIHISNFIYKDDETSEIKRFEDLNWNSERQLVQVFEDIPGADGNVWVTPPGDDELNGTIVRCELRNKGGVIYTKNMLLIVDDTPFDSNNDDSDRAIILGAVLGSVLGCVCICCVGLAVAMIIILVRMKKERIMLFSLEEPDYNEVLFEKGTERRVEYNVKDQQKKLLYQLKELLVKKDNLLAHAIMEQSVYSYNILHQMVTVFQYDGKAAELVTQMIIDELRDSKDQDTLFRLDSPAMKLYGQFVRFVGLKYLWKMLALPINSLNEQAKGTGDLESILSPRYERKQSTFLNLFEMTTMEIDPTKMEDAQDQTVNTLELWLVTQKFFNHIMKNKHKVPQPIVNIMADARKITEEKGWDGSTVYICMGNFFWLRFVCPSLVSPQKFGLVPETVHPTVQRQLLLVTKVLQSLANNSLPGTKEKHMEKLNEFITSNNDRLHKFYDELNSGGHYDKWQIEVDETELLNSLAGMHSWLLTKREEVENQLQEYGDDEVLQELQNILKKMPKKCSKSPREK